MKKASLMIVIAIVLASCANKKEEKERMILKITKMETEFTKSIQLQKIDPVLARDLATECNNYANLFPSDSNSPKMIYSAAVINLKYINDQTKAIELFIKLKEKYPKYKDTPMALYTAAYIYNDMLKNPEKAKECYELLIKDYPNHILANEAKVLIQFVGKSDEQLLNAIIGKNIDTSKPIDENEEQEKKNN